MAAASGHIARIYVDQDMSEPQIQPFASGEVAVFSARGPGKEGANEDAAGLFPIDRQTGVLAVADGLGGQPSGDYASQMALRRLRDSIARISPQPSATRMAVMDGVEAANQAILALGVGAATTLAVAEIAGPMLRAYHVGDSSILVVGQRGKVKLQTVPHSPVGYAVEAGLLDEEEAMHHDDRHLVSNIVGAPDMRIEVGSPMRLAARDTVLLATDGVYDNMSPSEIVDLIRTKPISRVAADIADLCRKRMLDSGNGAPSKPDDLSFLLFRLRSID